jgi:TPP-dependent pyruvate/acetoin dehydrogenase alpha subunit
MKKDIAIKIYFEILRVRKIELEISKKYSEQKMRCPIHLSIGQEAIPVAICRNLNKADKAFTAHRSHAHYLAKGGNLKKMLAELYGKKSGCAEGKGGSMHLIDLKAGLFGAVPIVGSTIPIGVGAAWYNKLNRKKSITVIFFGDGATEEGVFQESLDFASLHSLPVLFVCEHNNYSVYSNIKKRQSQKRNILNIAKAIGIEGMHLDGNNSLNLYKKSKIVINNIRKKNRPFIFLCDTFRHLEHCGPNNDDNLNYRDKEYVSYWMKNCPLKKIEKYLLKKNFLSQKTIINFNKKINNEIKEAFLFADNSKFPEKEDFYKDVYA